MNKLPALAFVVVLAAFGVGLIYLFQLRFERGDVYPEYSSLRADPLGTKAFYEGLDRLLVARRHFTSLSKLGEGRQTCLLYLGTDAMDLDLLVDDWRRLEAFVASGGRLVMTFRPSYQAAGSVARKAPGTPAPATRGATNSPSPAPPGQPPPQRAAPDPSSPLQFVSLDKRWGARVHHVPIERDEFGRYVAELARRKLDANLPETISCHTALVFTNLAQPWRVIYARTHDEPVMIERAFGGGTVILSADSYLLSNEAMRQERHPDLLAWLIGPSRRVIFEEGHLGVAERPGVVSLARKYRLHGLGVGLLLLAALFVWKNSASFLPSREERASAEAPGAVAGREAAAGFVNLLRRNIGSDELLGVCILEWKKSCGPRVSTSRLQQIQSVIDAHNKLPVRQRNPIETYRAISRILSRRAQPGGTSPS